MVQKINYWQQKAESWVSMFVLVGCVAITIILVVTVIRAADLGKRLGSADSDVSQSY